MGCHGDSWGYDDFDWDLLWDLPSGKRLQCANLKIAIEFVDLPMKNCDFP